MILFSPSSLKRVAIALYNNKTFYTENFEYMPFLNVYRATIPANTVKKFTPSFDFFNTALQGALTETAKAESNYNFGLVNSLNVNAITFFKAVDTYTWSKFISSPQNNVLKTSGKLSLPVIMPYDEDQPNSKFLQQIWRLGVYWFVPFFLSTDVYPQNIGGPLFVKKFSITASESVSVDLDFIGGSGYVFPENLYQNKNWIDFKNYYNLDELPATNLGYLETGVENYSNLRSVYRVAKTYDCLLLLDQAPFREDSKSNNLRVSVGSTTFYDTYSPLATATVVQGNNITSMSLDIDNELEEKYTANDGVNKNIVNGMRYISLKSRSVSGSIEFIASQNLQSYFDTGVNKTLVMYFGGPFYFPMENVSFQVFSLDISADKASYIHKVNFTALLQESAYSQYYNQNEFNVHLDGLFGSPTGRIYVKPQDKPNYND
jgi:hypothetical protein